MTLLETDNTINLTIETIYACIPSLLRIIKEIMLIFVIGKKIKHIQNLHYYE